MCAGDRLPCHLSHCCFTPVSPEPASVVYDGQRLEGQVSHVSARSCYALAPLRAAASCSARLRVCHLSFAFLSHLSFPFGALTRAVCEPAHLGRAPQDERQESLVQSGRPPSGMCKQNLRRSNQNEGTNPPSTMPTFRRRCSFASKNWRLPMAMRVTVRRRKVG